MHMKVIEIIHKFDLEHVLLHQINAHKELKRMATVNEENLLFKARLACSEWLFRVSWEGELAID